MFRRSRSYASVLSGLAAYTARTVAHSPDARDRRSQAIQQVIDAAIEDRVERSVAAQLVPAGSEPRLPAWPAPTREARHLAHLALVAATTCVRRGAALLQVSSVLAGSTKVPEPRLQFQDHTRGELAPLVYACLEEAARYELTTLLALYHSPRMDELWSEDVRLGLRRRLNAYLELELNLWWLARESGFSDPLPYAVRYENARWLWSPKIAGVVACLRCGERVSHVRAGRMGKREPRCASCSRGNPTAWPAHAIAPHDRGRWWLACQVPSCANAFKGPSQARHCPAHRSARLTRSRRTSRREAA
jgi:hypothetical protein